MFAYTNFNPFMPPKPQTETKKPEKPEPKGPPAPPRLMVLAGGGREAVINMAPNYAKAIEAAVAAFEIPNTYVARLAVPKSDMPPWLGKFSDPAQQMMFIADDGSYQYVTSGRQVVRVEVLAFEKTSTVAAPPAPPPGSSCPVDFILENKGGSAMRLTAEMRTDKDVQKGAPVGTYAGNLRITTNPLKIEFVGREA